MCGEPKTDRVQGHCSWLGVWGRIAPILSFFPSLLFAERGQQGGFESFIFIFMGFGGGAPIAFLYPAQDAGLK